MSKTKTLGRTMWQPTRPPMCVVESLRDPPPEIELHESYGRMHVKGTDPEFAEKVYRNMKHMPADWPIRVTVKDGDGKAVSVHDYPPLPIEPSPAKVKKERRSTDE